MARPAPAGPDLLTWPLLQEAQLRAEQALADRAEAARRYEIAPHGERENRLAALRRATAAAIAAEQQLRQLREEVRH